MSLSIATFLMGFAAIFQSIETCIS
jgi:hypothetical protein